MPEHFGISFREAPSGVGRKRRASRISSQPPPDDRPSLIFQSIGLDVSATNQGEEGLPGPALYPSSRHVAILFAPSRSPKISQEHGIRV